MLQKQGDLLQQLLATMPSANEATFNIYLENSKRNFTFQLVLSPRYSTRNKLIETNVSYTKQLKWT